jgi:hypothetical protein
MSHSGRLIVPVKVRITNKAIQPSDTEIAKSIIKKNKNKYFNKHTQTENIFIGFGRSCAVWSGNRSYIIQN